jgi:hypothetical protein
MACNWTLGPCGADSVTGPYAGESVRYRRTLVFSPVLISEHQNGRKDMNYLIKRCSHSDIKNKMVAIYILNVTDMIFTLMLCGTGYFMEVNPHVATF